MNLKTLRALAPQDLLLSRTDRYDGGGSSVSLDRLGKLDLPRITLLYNAIDAVSKLQSIEAHPEPGLALVRAFNNEPLRDSALRFGRDSDWSDPALARILHDVRGGALSVLVGYSDLDLTLEDLRTCVVLARDHVKMMRNAFYDIDPVQREEDERLHVHPLTEYLGKWQGRCIPMGGRRVMVAVDNHFDGYYSDRCLETSAVDRVVYNLTNNAARFSDDDRVEVTTFLTCSGIVRWVFSNKVSQANKHWLQENVGEDLNRLFAGGLTKGGNGIGLTSCARFVGDAFGTGSPERAIEQGYLGARVVEDIFHAWFHWPVYEPVAGDPICSCSHDEGRASRN